MRTILSVAASSLVLLSAHGAGAQTAETKAPLWSLSIGADPTHFDLRTRDPGVDARLIATLTRSWVLRNPAARFHVSLMTGFDAPHGFRDREGVQVDITRRYAGLTGGASYEFFRKSRIRPYVSAGTGVYHDLMRADSKCDAGPCGEVTPLGLIHRRDNTSFGINAAIGLRMRLGGRELFIEQAQHVFDARHSAQGITPFSFGIRF
jgi:hypothetical protein